MEDRREFLKTLGKLTAAVGVTAAVATSLPAKGKELNHTEFMKEMSKPVVVPKGAIQEALQTKKYADEAVKNLPKKSALTYTTAPITPGKDTLVLVEECNRIHNMRVDNARMGLPPHHYFFDNHARAIAELDPYNWQKVYTLEWEDFKPRDPAQDILTGLWLATVRPYFESCFDKPCYYRSVSVSRNALLAADTEVVKRYAKDNGFREIVRNLQDEILDRIKRDVRSRT